MCVCFDYILNVCVCMCVGFASLQGKFSLEMFVHFERSIVAAVWVDLVIRVHDVVVVAVVVVADVVVMTVHGVAGVVVVVKVV